MDDFARISHVPVFVCNILNATHAGTYWEPNGGKAATAVVAWRDWQLRGDRRAAKTFVGAQCDLCTDPAWVIQKKMIDSTLAACRPFRNHEHSRSASRQTGGGRQDPPPVDDAD